MPTAAPVPRLLPGRAVQRVPDVGGPVLLGVYDRTTQVQDAVVLRRCVVYDHLDSARLRLYHVFGELSSPLQQP